ncbi:uncharacterized protein YALI1_D25563g [Yarrowia lipolytica]|uniref:Uncharacterized protein n=1 Tax=Yarrowia lipolytica TaxID=4952 RepID=A0A1D8NFE5_YARLL|nr:hypothetical protein YALI1_D25563g [Yarrowia lipolytica]
MRTATWSRRDPPHSPVKGPVLILHTYSCDNGDQWQSPLVDMTKDRRLSNIHSESESSPCSVRDRSERTSHPRLMLQTVLARGNLSQERACQ